jgi:hypothetical protein
VAVPPETTRPVERFLAEVRKAPWGTLAKSELDFLVFSLMTETGDIDLADSDSMIASDLLTTPARVRSLRFRFEQRRFQHLDEHELAEQIVRAIVPFSVDGERSLFVHVESVYLLDRLIDQMRRKNRLVRRDLTRGLIKVDLVDLFLTLNDLGALTEPDGVDLRAELDEILRDKNRQKRFRQFGDVLGKLSSVAGVARLVTSIAGML